MSTQQSSTDGARSTPGSQPSAPPESGPSHLDQLVGSLLYEGYALYPYTPGATKNATPTPFGIVYPPAYADSQLAAFDRMQIECVITDAEAPVTGEVRFLMATGDRHKGSERRIDLGRPGRQDFDFDGVSGRATMNVQPLPDGKARVTLRIENRTELDPEEAKAMERPQALLLSFLSCHLVARVSGGARFISPLERGDDGVAGCCNVNTWPVLAAQNDDAVLGPAIMLSDYPRISPHSVNDFFDGTEIEEALVLHIQTLSDQERAEIAEQDPKVREMLARADATTPEQLMDLHGRVRLEDPPGEPTALIGDTVVKRGDKVILRPGLDGDPYDKMLDGRTATVHRIFIDYSDRTHIGVTIDDDALHEIFRDSGRFTFFFANELEVVQ